jgi:hypothetical protein
VCVGCVCVAERSSSGENKNPTWRFAVRADGLNGKEMLIYRMGQPCLQSYSGIFFPIWYNLFDGKWSALQLHIGSY